MLLSSHCHIIILTVGQHIKAIRKALIAKKYGLQKLRKCVEGEGKRDWKKSKYCSLISYLKTTVIQMKGCIHIMLNKIDNLCHFLAIVNNAVSLYKRNSHVQLQNQENYKCLL